MIRTISRIDNLKVAQGLVEFAKKLNLTITKDINDIFEGAYLTTSSPKFEVNWIRRDEYAAIKAKEAGIAIYNLHGDLAAEDFVGACLSAVPDPVDEVTLDNDVPNDVVIKLYNKIKGQKKSPSRYYVVFKNDTWTASTNSEGSLGILSNLYSNI